VKRRRSQQLNSQKKKKQRNSLTVFGLGNPFPKYKDTRHNVGFMVVDKLAKDLGVRFTHHSAYHAAHSDKFNMTLVKPMLYMNNSGIAVREFLQTSDKPDDFIVVYDDITLPLGRIRIREKGSDGGHQGMASIIYHLLTNNFPRLRVGIGKPMSDISATEYVLEKFSRLEKQILDKTIDNVCSALLMIKDQGIKMAMNQYNSISFTTEMDEEIKK
jgi:PTH1 family peptidyl-tRNA hydrolase